MAETGLCIYDGNLVLVLDSALFDQVEYIDQIVPELARTNRYDSNGQKYYMTIICKSEYHIKSEQIETLRRKYDWDRFAIIGIGSTCRKEPYAKTYYQIVWHPVAAKVRKLLKLQPKDFHITLGFEGADVPDQKRDISTMVKPNPDLIESVKSCVDMLSEYQLRLLLDILDKYKLDGREHEHEHENEHKHKHEHKHELEKSYENLKLRIRICYLLKDFDTCLKLLDSITDPEYSFYVQTSRAFMFLKQNRIYDALQILKAIPEDARDHNWDSLMSDARYRATFRSDTGAKQVIHIDSQEIELSQNFSWLIPFKLAAISVPRSADEIRAFQHANIGLVITVMEDTILPDEWFENMDIEYCYYSVPSSGTPTIGEMDEIMSKIERMLGQDRGILVHCDEGKGRTGTVCACFVAKHGLSGLLNAYPQMSSSDAIAYVREMRSGSVESARQEKFVSDYVEHLYAERFNNDFI